jgi:hypothetical protein
VRLSVDWKSRTARFDPIGYEISVGDIWDEAEILEWIDHLSEKNWTHREIVGGVLSRGKDNFAVESRSEISLSAPGF